MAKPARKNARKKSQSRPAGRRTSGTIPVRLAPETIAAIDALIADADLAWRAFACAVLADELG
jgi:hypothetical protein